MTSTRTLATPRSLTSSSKAHGSFTQVRTQTPPPTRTCSKLQNTMTKIGIKYNLTHQNRSGQKMASTPEPVIRPSPAFLKEIKTDPALHQKKKFHLIPTYSFLTPKIRGI